MSTFHPHDSRNSSARDPQTARHEQPTLRTERLILRSFRPGDGPAVERYAGAREVAATTLHIAHPYPAGGGELWIATHGPAWETGARMTCALTRPDDDEPFGAVGLSLTREHARGELGYWIAVHEWGRGYATEASRALVEYGFAALGLHRIQARHLARNPSSGRVMEKLGMRREGVARDWALKDGRFEDIVMWAVLVDEFEGMRAGKS
jgi:[ribosomal protein S5]-alanine N-acetyltransferase